MSNQKIVTETALSALASDIKTALSGKANSNDVYPKSQTYNRTEIDNALALKADKSELYNVYPTDQESGAIAHITDGTDNIPVKSLSSQIVAVESGSGEKSPDNSYTISGFDSGVITRCGVNLWDEDYETGGISTSTGLPDSNANYRRSKNFMPCRPNIDLFSYSKNNAQIVLYFYDKNQDFISFAVSTQTTQTTPTNCFYFKIRILSASPAPVFAIGDVSINYPSSDTQYHAYNGNTYTFAFGQTVYGGHFDNKGNLVVTHGFIDLGTLSGWSYNSAQNFWQHAIPDIESGTDDALCEGYNYTNRSWGSMVNYEFGISGTSMRLHNDTVSTSAELETQLNGIHLKYLLANPITLTITSQDIPTLLGENNIFSNCGDVEVDYHADIGLYIDKKISSLAQG